MELRKIRDDEIELLQDFTPQNGVVNPGKWCS